MIRIPLKLFFISLFLFGCATTTLIPESEPLAIGECKAIQKLLYKANTTPKRELAYVKGEGFKNILRGLKRGLSAYSSGELIRRVEADYQQQKREQIMAMQAYIQIPEPTKARCSNLGF